MNTNNDKDAFDTLTQELRSRILPEVEQIIIQRTEEHQGKINNNLKSMIETAFSKALKENPITVTHHGTEDMADCPNCKPKLDKKLNEAQESGHKEGYELGKAANRLSNLKAKADKMIEQRNKPKILPVKEKEFTLFEQFYRMKVAATRLSDETYLELCECANNQGATLWLLSD